MITKTPGLSAEEDWPSPFETSFPWGWAAGLAETASAYTEFVAAIAGAAADCEVTAALSDVTVSGTANSAALTRAPQPVQNKAWGSRIALHLIQRGTSEGLPFSSTTACVSVAVCGSGRRVPQVVQNSESGATLDLHTVQEAKF